MEQFFEEQLLKWLPDYALKKNGNATITDQNYDTSAKRRKQGDDTIQIINTDDADDDVLLA